MEPTTEQSKQDPYHVRPEEWVYFAGWLAFIAAGPYLIYRGLTQDRSYFVILGVIVILVGLTLAAVIAIRALRPWRKTVRVAWTIIIAAGIIANYIIEASRRPM